MVSQRRVKNDPGCHSTSTIGSVTQAMSVCRATRSSQS